MLRLIACVTTEHDFVLVLLAVFVCASSVLAAFKAYAHALSESCRSRNAWLVTTGASAASGIWATHFVAMLAYNPGVAMGFDPTLTAVSLAIAAAGTTLGFWIAASGAGRNGALAGGALAGITIGAMHYSGMAAVEVAGAKVWEPVAVIVSVIAGSALAAAAMHRFHAVDNGRVPCVASALMVAAIAVTHFVGMSALTVTPDPTIAVNQADLDRTVMVMGIAFVTAAVLLAGVAAALVERLNYDLGRQTASLRDEVEERRRTQKELEEGQERLVSYQSTLSKLMQDDAVRKGTCADAMRELSQELIQTLGVDRAGSWLFNETRDAFAHGEVFVAAAGKFVRPNYAFEPAHAASMLMTSSKDVVAVDDLGRGPAFDLFLDNAYAGLGIKSMLHVPIMARGSLAGILTCATTGKAITWLPEQKMFASGVAGLASLVIERTEREKVEKDLREANVKAAAASRAKTMFLANMSHEIRTPMNGVLGMTDLLSRTPLDERQQRLAATISQSARTLLSIINDILDISRIEEGRLELDQHEFELDDCVEDVVAILSEEAQKKGLDLSLFVDDEAVGTTEGDSVRLRQVLLNLIGNAVKFTTAGEVSVRVEAGAGNTIRFQVRDTGIGIDPHVIGRVFQPFMQADTSISRRFGGTGLGLSISRHLVSLMGGSLEIESTPGEGTCVTFDLPISIRRSAVVGRRKGERALAGHRILVVDDRETNREIACSYLASSGAIAEGADGAEQAQAMMAAAASRGQAYGLAVVDLLMPGVDGLEFCKRVRADEQLGGTRLVLLSSMSWQNESATAREAGIDRLLHKPLRRDDLVKTIASLLIEQAALDQAAVTPAPETFKLGLKVLVAEDNPVNQVVAAEYLANLGCTVTNVENGLQAVAALERDTYDVVLMDCQMPEMDGLTATRLVREREGERGEGRVPILAVTANAYEEDRRNCFAAGMDSYLSKPFSEAQLLAALLPMTGRRKDAAPAAESPAEQAQAPDPAALQPLKPVKSRKSQGATSKPRSCKPKAVKAAKPLVTQRVAASPVAPAAAEPTRSALEALRSTRPEVYRKLVRAYLEFAPQAAGGLPRLLRKKECVAIERVAHSLKSASANVGANELAAICAELQTAGRDGDLALCRRLSAKVGPELDAAVARLEVELAAHEKELVA